MKKSKSIAGIVGPTLVVIVLSEMKLWNPTLYDTQSVPLIYLNGVLFFTAGLVIVKSHNIWTYSWRIFVTLIGYLLILLGIFRMFFPHIQKSEFNNNKSVLTIQIILIFIGAFLTFKAYFQTK